jgi:hypothetical protein
MLLGFIPLLFLVILEVSTSQAALGGGDLPSPIKTNILRQYWTMAQNLRQTAFILVGALVLLSGCGVASVQSTAPRRACSLMTMKEAAAVLNGPITTPQEGSLTITNQSSCLYLSKGSLGVSVSWSKRAVTTFTVLHNGHAHWVPTTSPTGWTTPPPRYTEVSVDGTHAYWLVNATAPPGSNLPTNTGNLTAMKHGYVVQLISTRLNDSQDEQALAVILNRL